MFNLLRDDIIHSTHATENAAFTALLKVQSQTRHGGWSVELDDGADDYRTPDNTDYGIYAEYDNFCEGWD